MADNYDEQIEALEERILDLEMENKDSKKEILTLRACISNEQKRLDNIVFGYDKRSDEIVSLRSQVKAIKAGMVRRINVMKLVRICNGEGEYYMEDKAVECVFTVNDFTIGGKTFNESNSIYSRDYHNFFTSEGEVTTPPFGDISYMVVSNYNMKNYLHICQTLTGDTIFVRARQDVKIAAAHLMRTDPMNVVISDLDNGRSLVTNQPQPAEMIINFLHMDDDDNPVITPIVSDCKVSIDYSKMLWMDYHDIPRTTHRNYDVKTPYHKNRHDDYNKTVNDGELVVIIDRDRELNRSTRIVLGVND